MSWSRFLLFALAWAFLCRLAGANDKPGIRTIESDPVAGESGAVVVRGLDLIQTSPVGPGPDMGATASQQAADVCSRLDSLLRQAGSGLKRTVRLNVYITDSAQAGEVRRVIAERVDSNAPPAVSWVTTALPVPGALVAMDAIAAADPKAAEVEIRSGEGQTFSVLPASATSRSYVSGQAEKAATAAEGTRLTMASLMKTLDFLGHSKSDVTQLKVFIAPMKDADKVSREIATVFSPASPPPITMVEWKSTDYPVEIELVAVTTKPLTAPRPVVEFLTPPGMTTPTVYCRVARVQSPSTVFLSGLYGDQEDPNGEAELRQLFDRTQKLAEEAGSDMRHLVKATYYVSAPGSSQQHNRLRPEYYDPSRPPAASKALVEGVGRPGRTITWDMIAVPK